MRLPAILSLVLLAPVASAEDAKTPDLVFLCIGQSNMSGRAPMKEGDDAVMEGVLLLNAEGAWEPAKHPLNRYGTDRKSVRMQRFGLAGPFARKLRAAMPDKTIGLIVNARGGTQIEEWAKGRKLYENSLNRVRKLKDTKVAGVLWVQGFNNAGDNEYLGKLEKLVDDLRADLSSPDLPIVAGQVPLPQAAPVNRQIVQLPERRKRTGAATNEGYAKCDAFHYDRDSYIRLGERMAAAYLRLIGAAPTTTRPTSGRASDALPAPSALPDPPAPRTR